MDCGALSPTRRMNWACWWWRQPPPPPASPRPLPCHWLPPKDGSESPPSNSPSLIFYNYIHLLSLFSYQCGPNPILPSPSRNHLLTLLSLLLLISLHHHPLLYPAASAGLSRSSTTSPRPSPVTAAALAAPTVSQS